MGKSSTSFGDVDGGYGGGADRRPVRQPARKWGQAEFIVQLDAAMKEQYLVQGN
jgi:hypothetical protein